MQLLSIVLTFCDNDFCFLEEMYKKIKENVKIPYELILVDNREKNTETLNEEIESSAIHVKVGYNANCIPGRIFGAEKASGKYLWFIDVDDEVCLIDEKMSMNLDFDEDILSFYYNGIKSDSLSNPLTSEFGKYIYDCGVSVWNKWYKKSSFLSVKESVINTGLTFYGEDFVYNYFVFNLNKSYRNLNDNIYIHGQSTGSANGILKMQELFDWQKKEDFTSIEMEDVHKIYLNFIVHNIYGDYIRPDEILNAERKIAFFHEMLEESFLKGWIKGIQKNNKLPEKYIEWLKSKLS